MFLGGYQSTSMSVKEIKQRINRFNRDISCAKCDNLLYHFWHTWKYFVKRLKTCNVRKSQVAGRVRIRLQILKSEDLDLALDPVI